MTARADFADAERRLFAVYGLDCESHGLALEDPALSIGVRESGAGDPVVFIHAAACRGWRGAACPAGATRCGAT